MTNRERARAQQREDYQDNLYRMIVASNFVRTRQRRPVPAACISALADSRCYPRREADGT